MLVALLAGWLTVAAAQDGTAVGPAHASESLVGFNTLPSEKDVKKLDVAGYNDLLMDDDYRLLLHMVQEFRMADQAEDPQAHATFLMQMAATMRTAAERTRQIPPFKKDASLRDGVAAAYDAWAGLFDEELKLLGPLSAVVKSDKDVEKVEALRVPLDARWQTAEDAPARAQAAFAKNHQLTLVEGELDPELDAILNFPAFEAKGLPPKGSGLPAEDWCAMGIGYHNGLIDLQNQLVDAGNAMASEKDDAKLEDTRMASLAKTRELRTEIDTYGPLAGDDGWAAALQEYARWQEDQLASDWKEYARIVGSRKQLRKKDVDQLNKIGEAFFKGTDKRLYALAGHRDDLVKRFAFAQYEVWAEKRSEVLRSFGQ